MRRQQSPPPLVVNGWSIFAHPLFLDQIDNLVVEIERLRAKDPEGYTGKRAAKLLAAISKLAFEVIPGNPANPNYRQGSALGENRKHWFRARFFQQFRLFFRYQEQSKIIIFASVNDDDSKRAHESSNDACRTFRRMLKSGHPPDEWDALLREAKTNSERLKRRASRSA